MSNIKHRVSKDLKNQILDRIKTSGKSMKVISDEYSISKTIIYEWLKHGVEGTTNKEIIKLAKENKELKLIIGELTVQLGVGQKKGWR